MGQQVEATSHSCGTTRGLKIFQQDDGTYNGYCFACGTFVTNPYEDKPAGFTAPVQERRSPQDIQEQLDEAQTYPFLASAVRGLGRGTMEYFGIRSRLSEYQANEVTAWYFPYYVGNDLVGTKVKTVDGKLFALGTTRGVDPFGWRQAMLYGDRFRLFITEGEFDAAALYKALKPQWRGEREPSVISLINGSKSVIKTLESKIRELRTFKEIVLVYDNDEPGQLAVRDTMKLLGPDSPIKVVTLPLKDANDMVLAGREDELFRAVMYEGVKKVSGKSFRASEQWQKALTPPEMGLSWPWSTLTDKMRGRRRKEVYYIGGGVKIGKSVVVDEIVAHCLATQDTPVWVCKPEEPMQGTVKRVAGKLVDRIFHDPKIPFDVDAFNSTRDRIGNQLILFDTYQSTDWDDVKHEIRHVVMSEGVKDVLIDPITCFTIGLSLTEQNEELVRITGELAGMAAELDFTAYVFCHLNAPSSGPAHERGGAVQSVQFAGSRSMMRACHAMFGLEGNKDPDLPEEIRNSRRLVILEDRNFGESGVVNLFYNNQTGRLKEAVHVGDD